MKKLIIAIGFALALAGCATLKILTGDVVPPRAVYIAINAFDAVEVTATNYLRLPLCGTGPTVCRDPQKSASIVTWVRAGRADRNTLKSGLRSNPKGNLSIVNVYNDLRNVTAQLGALVQR